MHIALKGALIGLGIAIAMVAFEYWALKKQVEERARIHHVKPEFEQIERARMMAVVRFAFFVPPAAALFAWLGSMMT